jgi:hypothetical protein
LTKQAKSPQSDVALRTGACAIVRFTDRTIRSRSALCGRTRNSARRVTAAEVGQLGHLGNRIDGTSPQSTRRIVLR